MDRKSSDDSVVFLGSSSSSSEEAPKVRRMVGVPYHAMHGNAFERLRPKRPKWASTKSRPVKEDENDLELTAPIMVSECVLPARAGYERSMEATEYCEDPATLQRKVKMLAEMVRASHCCVAYTGAGLSTGAGIGDYASRCNDSSVTKGIVKQDLDPYQALPGLSQRVLVALHENGMLQQWLQQNHDGLPQKAGLPQHCVNEIHGAWFDPSNPVVTMSGDLRRDLIKRMDKSTREADLVLALGTSLAAVGADKIVDAVSRRQLSHRKCALGAVIISLQRTYFDDVCALRIFGKLDEVLGMLAEELSLSVPPPGLRAPSVPPACVLEEDVFLVPYGEDGERLEGLHGDGLVGKMSLRSSAQTEASTSSSSSSAAAEPPTSMSTTAPVDTSRYRIWDLRKGSKVRIVYGPGAGLEGTMLGRDTTRKKARGGGSSSAAAVTDRHVQHYLVSFPRIVAHNDDWLIRRSLKRDPDCDPRAPRTYIMGYWWPEAAAKGQVDRLPFISIPASASTAGAVKEQVEVDEGAAAGGGDKKRRRLQLKYEDK